MKPARPTLPRIKTASATSTPPWGSTSARLGPSPIVPSPSTSRRSTTSSLRSALAGVGGVVRKGVKGVVSAGVGVVGTPVGSRRYNAPDESAFVGFPTSSRPPAPANHAKARHPSPPFDRASFLHGGLNDARLQRMLLRPYPTSRARDRVEPSRRRGRCGVGLDKAAYR